MSWLPGVSERWLKADPDVITPADARWVLGYYDLDGGDKPGGFRTHLIEAMTQADPGNLRRLALGFRGLVAAFQAQQDVAGLQAIAESDQRARSYSWNQPICEDCYQIRYPGRGPVRVKDVGDPEVCVDCGRPTSDGIFYRIDPGTAKHPTRLKD